LQTDDQTVADQLVGPNPANRDQILNPVRMNCRYQAKGNQYRCQLGYSKER
jgi:hypothetical protein